jgi:hypothetical protein
LRIGQVRRCHHVHFDLHSCRSGPDPLDAAMLYAACATAAVGIPEIIPVKVSRLNPGGHAGLTLYEVTVPVTAGGPTLAVIVVRG